MLLLTLPRTWFIRSLYYNCLSILWARPCYLGTVHAAIRLTMRLLLFLWHCFAWNKTHVSIPLHFLEKCSMLLCYFVCSDYGFEMLLLLLWSLHTFVSSFYCFFDVYCPFSLSMGASTIGWHRAEQGDNTNSRTSVHKNFKREC